MGLQRRAIADYLTLVILKLTNYNFTPHGDGPGDPAYLKPDQVAQLAVTGIRILTQQLPQETAQKIEAALVKYPQGQQVEVEEMLVNVGGLGGVIHHGNSGPPGCCVMMNGHLVCIRTESATHV